MYILIERIYVLTYGFTQTCMSVVFLNVNNESRSHLIIDFIFACTYIYIGTHHSSKLV